MATTLRTACNRDCPDACALLVTVEDGVVRSLRGDPDHPVTRGFLCYRTGRFEARRCSPDRLRTPLLRRGGRQVPISWDEAFDRIEDALRAVLDRDGPAAVCPVRTGGSLGLTKGLTDYFFRLLGPVTEVAGDICGGAGTRAQELDFGVSESHDFFDIRRSRQVVLWGKNAGIANVHLVPVLAACRKQGTRILVVDPVPPAPALPGLPRIAPRPGGDVELALGAGRWILDEVGLDALRRRSRVGFDGLDGYARLCRSRSVGDWAGLAGVAAAEVAALGRALLDGPAAILVGWGLQRRRRGGLAVRAIDALGAVSGNLGVPGGGVSFHYRRRAAFRTEVFGTGRAPARTIDLALLGHDLLAARNPRIRFLWLSCANPVASLPDARAVARAIEETEFSVAVDSHPTDTTRRAALVLPSATLLEHGDILGAYGHHWVQLAAKVVEPPPGVRSDLEIVQELGRRFGLGRELAGTAEQWADRLIRPEARAGGLSLEALRAGAVRNPTAEPVLFAGGRVATETGRVRLLGGSDYAAPPARPDPAFPLWLFTSSHRRAQSSQWVAGEADEGPLEARLHPAAAAGLRDGELATLASRQGTIRVRIRLDPRLREDCVVTPKSGALDLGRAPNVLVPARRTDIGGGAAYLDVRVRVVSDRPAASIGSPVPES